MADPVVADPVLDGLNPADLLKETGLPVTAFLPDDLKADKALGDFKDIGSLARAFVDTKKMVGGSLRIPGKDAKPEDLAKWQQDELPKLRAAGLIAGPPASPELYKFTRPEAALLGGWDDAEEKDFLGLAYKAGLSDDQVQGMVGWYGAFVGRMMQKGQEQAQTIETALRQEYGANYDAHLGRANRAIQEFGGDDLIDLYAKTGVGRHPLNVKAWIKIGNALVEHGAMPATGEPGITPDEATAKIDAIFADKTHPFNKRSHPDHKQAIDEMLALNRIAGKRG